MGKGEKFDEAAMEVALAEQREMLAPTAARLARLGVALDELARERGFRRPGIWDEATQPPLPFKELGEE